MIKKSLILGSAILTLGLFTGCGNGLSISAYPIRVSQPVMIPDVCKMKYKSLMNVPRVAIMKFTNNSSFSKASVSNSNKNSTYQGGVLAGLIATQHGVGLGAGVQSNKHINTNITHREVDPKLDKAISSALEGILAQIGGVDVYSRADLTKVMKEQKLQQSGLFDEKTLVKVGKLAGVQYIITGSIDAVSQEYDNYANIANMAGNAVAQHKKKDLTTQLLGSFIKLGGSMASGLKITTTVTFKVINVTTGKIVFSKQITETKNIGNIANPTYSQIIGGIKVDVMTALQILKPDISGFFTPSGYITQIKTNSDHDEFIAQINLGSNEQIQPGQTFDVYKFDEFVDPITGKTMCDESAMNVKLIVSKNQIQLNSSWTIVKGDDANQLRAGQIVKRDALKTSLLSF